LGQAENRQRIDLVEVSVRIWGGQFSNLKENNYVESEVRGQEICQTVSVIAARHLNYARQKWTRAKNEPPAN
jgi:hypothetical protein